MKPASAWRGLLILAYATVAGLNLPGQTPFDTVTALWEGRTHVRMSWGPRMYSALLGLFDAVVPGTGLFTAASILTLFLAWAALAKIAPRVSWAAPALLALWLATPHILILQGVVWRDVLFADLTVAGFVALAGAAKAWAQPARRWSLLALAAACLALGALVRQNGGVVIGAAGLALAWTARSGGWRRAVAWGGGGFLAVVALMFALALVDPVREPPGTTHAVGLQLLAHYDIMGALAEDPSRPLPRLQADQPAALAIARRAAPQVYSVQRIDTLDHAPALGDALWSFHAPAMMGAWRDLVLSDPLGYARRRLAVFRWVFMTPDLPACGPLHLGVSGLPDVEQKLGLRDGPYLNSARLFAYAHAWYRTPFYSHLTYALLACAVLAFLAIRRRPADGPIAGLMLGALGFTASFLAVSIACDYRYLYALDLAAMTGALYVALDPSLKPVGPQSPKGRSG